jgi:hypothetical protein
MHVKTSNCLLYKEILILYLENKEISSSHVRGKRRKIIQDNLEISSKLNLKEEQERENKNRLEKSGCKFVRTVACN